MWRKKIVYYFLAWFRRRKHTWDYDDRYERGFVRDFNDFYFYSTTRSRIRDYQLHLSCFVLTKHISHSTISRIIVNAGLACTIALHSINHIQLQTHRSQQWLPLKWTVHYNVGHHYQVLIFKHLCNVYKNLIHNIIKNNIHALYDYFID